MDVLREVLSEIPGNAMCHVLTEAYSALFEDSASTATHKTKRVIRDLFPPPKPEQHIDRVEDDSVRIGDQIWMSHNLQMPADREHGIYVVDGETYFTWEAAMRVAAEYCNGWRLPSREDWNKLFKFCGGDTKAGTHLKSTSGWNGDNGFDTYGFDGKPCGDYYPNYYGRDYPDCGEMENGGYHGFFWSSTPNGKSFAYIRYLSCNDSRFFESYNYKSLGLSVRLLKDSA